jgi:N-acetylglucosaminyl-diphospho-decaprenol L-rhamnosyltransferase
MFLTVQIVNYNSRDYLKDCLLSLGPFLLKNESFAELIIINNDADPIGDFLNEFPFLDGKLKVVELNENVGFGRAHNRGFSEASGDCVLFLNPDTEVVAESIDKMMEIIRSDEKVGIVAPSLISYDGEIQRDCYGFQKTPLSTIKAKLPRAKIFFGSEESFEVDWVSGGAMMLRKKLFSDLGGFDEKYFMYFEDVDLCFQAKKKGWKIIANPAAKVRHRNGKSFSSNQKKKKYYYASQDHYLKKNFGRFPAGLVKLARLPFYIKNIYFNK